MVRFTNFWKTRKPESAAKKSTFLPGLESLESRLLMDAAMATAVVAKPETAMALKNEVAIESIIDKSGAVVAAIVDEVKIQDVLAGHEGQSKEDQFFGIGGGITGTTGEFGVIHNDGKVDAKQDAQPVALVTGIKWGDTWLGGRWNGDGGVIDLHNGSDPILPGGGLANDGSGGQVSDREKMPRTIERDPQNPYGGKTDEDWFGYEMYDKNGNIREESYRNSTTLESYKTYTDAYGNRFKFNIDYFTGAVTPAGYSLVKMFEEKLPTDDIGGGSDWRPIGMKGSTLRPISLIGGDIDPAEIELYFRGISRYDGINIATETGGDDGAWEKVTSPISMEAAMEANFYSDPPRSMTGAADQVQAGISK